MKTNTIWMVSALFWAGVLIGAVSGETRGLEEEIGSLSFVAIGSVNISDPSNPSDSGQVELYETSLWTPFAGMEIGNTEIAAGGWASWSRFEFDGFPGDQTEDLYSLGLPLFLSHSFEDGWSGFISVMPMLNSDLESGHSADGKVLFHSAVEMPLKESLRLTLGVAYDTAFGENRWYPVGGVIWSVSPEVEIKLVLPSPSVYWTPSEDWGFFALVTPAGDQWSLYDENDGEMVLQTESWRFGLGAERRLYGPCWLRMAAGLDMERKYEFSRDNATVWESDVDDTWFASAALVLYGDLAAK